MLARNRRDLGSLWLSFGMTTDVVTLCASVKVRGYGVGSSCCSCDIFARGVGRQFTKLESDLRSAGVYLKMERAIGNYELTSMRMNVSFPRMKTP